MARILIEQTKHATYYYKADTVDELDRVARRILRERLDNGYVTAPGPLREEIHVDAAVTDEQIAALPGGQDLKATVEQRRAFARSEIARHESNTDHHAKVTALAAADTTVETDHAGRERSRAWDVLNARGSYEHEGVSLEDLIEVD